MGRYPVGRHPQRRPTLRRSVLCTLVGLFTSAPRLVMGQNTARVRRIGLLSAGTPGSPEARWQQMARLRELGWLEGQNLHVERRFASGRLDDLGPLAEELVQARVELIVTNGPNPTLAAMRATTTVPIVFMVASDPVGSGLVGSLARPGGNVTGFSASSAELNAKLLSLMKELVPGLQRIGTLVVSGNPQFQQGRSDLERSCRSAGIEPLFVDIAAASEIEAAIERMVQRRVQMLMLINDAFIIEHHIRIIAAALKRGLPTAGNSFAADGAVLTYSYSSAESASKWANYADRILRGTKPADLPVEQATRFELVINFKSAQALRLTVPSSLLLQADKVIR